jgi:Ran GTPase-activating protein (RanGAP) involved in mRNA processing and transport
MMGKGDDSGARSNRTLKMLDLSRNDVGGDDCRHLAAALEGNTTLLTLQLSSSEIGDNSRHLATALERNTTLKTLDLSWNKLGYNGCRLLAAALERNTMLMKLDLSRNSIGSDGVAALQVMPQSNCTLDEIIGVDVDGVVGVQDLLKSNREVRTARKRKVWWHTSLLLCC